MKVISKNVCNYNIYPRNSRIITDKGFINIDNGGKGDTHWTRLHIKDNKSVYSIFSVFNVMNFYLTNYPNKSLFVNEKTKK